MKNEFKRIKKLGKEIVGKSSFKKIKKIKNPIDRTESLKHLIASKIELKSLELESKLKEVDKKNRLLLESKLIMLPLKIKIFKTSYSRRDYTTLQKLIEKITKEIENV